MSSIPKADKDGQAQQRRKAKVEKLLQQALEGGTPNDYQALSDYLIDEPRFETLTLLLESLELSLVPSTPLDPTDLASACYIELARQSIYILPLLLHVLHHSPRQSASLKAYTEECLQMTLGRWGMILAWMALLLLHPPHGPIGQQIQAACSQVLLEILSDPESSPARREIASMRGTADFVYALLGQVDDQKKYHIPRPDSDSNPGVACVLSELFKVMFDSMAGWDAMEAKFTGMRRLKQRSMVQVFIGRAQQLAALADAGNITGVAISLDLLLQGIFSLCPNREVWDIFQRTKVLYECGAALYQLASKAQSYIAKDRECWKAISSSVFHLTYAVLNCSMNPTQEVPKLVGCGILRSAMLCLPPLKLYAQSRGTQGRSNQWKDAIQALDMIAPYFYLERVFQAASEHGDFHFHQSLRSAFLNPTESQRITTVEQVSQGPAEAIWRGFLRLFMQAKQAHIGRMDIPISLCGNSKHVEHHPNLPEMAVRTCCRCRSIMYCSRECQVEDWRRFHRRECDFAALRAQALRIPTGTRPYVQMMRDQLRHLESAATENDIVKQVRHTRPMPHRNQRNYNATFPVLEFSTMHQLPYTRVGGSAGFKDNPNNPHALVDPHPHNTSDTVTLGADLAPDAGEWERRYQAYVNEATLNPEKVVLIDGVFRYAEMVDVEIRVLAKLRVGGKGGRETGKGKYRVVGSVFRVGVKERER